MNLQQLVMRFDMRAPEWGAEPVRLYRAMLDMAEWADEHGFDVIRVSEHHASDDGYCPSPLVLLASIAARTTRARLRAAALILPLHDPLRVAEDAAVLDLLSGGRAELLIGAGYREEEFAMFGKHRMDRVRLVERGIEALRKAWTGEPFEHEGATARVTPKPVQPGGPPIYLGGSSTAAAKRAARIADGFIPVDEALYAVYAGELARLGKLVPEQFPPKHGPSFVYVTHDPDSAWHSLTKHAMHETNEYAAWLATDSGLQNFSRVDGEGAMRQNPAYRVVRPEECVELIRGLGPGGIFTLHPLLAGLDPDLAWSSLELFASEVLPHLGQPVY